MQEVNWNSLQGNKYLQSLHPLMLSTEGYKVEKFDRVTGMSRYAEKIPLLVTFDRTYLVEYIEKAIFDKLQLSEWNQAQPIISEAWKLYKSKQQKKAA